MKILLCNSFYYPNVVGGTEHSVKILAEGLTSRGHEVIVVTCDGEESFDSVVDNIPVIRIKSKWFSSKLFQYGTKPQKINLKLRSIFNVAAMNQVHDIISRYNPDVVNTNGLYGLSPSVWLAAHYSRVPVVHTLRDYYLLDPRSNIGSTPKPVAQLYRFYTKWMCNRYVDAVTSPSEMTLSAHIRRGYFNKSHTAVIPNCVLFSKQKVLHSIEEKKSRTDSSISFLYVGSLAQHKGVSNLISAFKLVDNQSISLRLAGDGPLRNMVKSAEDSDFRIEYCGNLDSDALAYEYERADVLIVPSIWEEPFGRVVIEGFSHGLPVIGANRGGIREIISRTGAGEMINSDSVADLAEMIERFCSRVYIKSYLPRIYSAVDLYSLDTQLDAFEKTYDEVISK